MATFAKTAYDAAAYSSFRPVYPPRLYDTIWAFHKAGLAARKRSSTQSSGGDEVIRNSLGWQRAVDLGCGTGQATVEIAARFEETIGVDPSSKMIQQATQMLSRQSVGTSTNVNTNPVVTEEGAVVRGGNLRYHQAAGEDLSFLEDQSVDFVSAAQAVHWFDYPKLWKEIDRVLRPGGTVAFWGYSEFRVRHYPQLTPLITYYSQGSNPTRIQQAVIARNLYLRFSPSPAGSKAGEENADKSSSSLSLHVPSEPESLSAYWEQPGRAILDGGLVAVPHPSTLLPLPSHDNEKDKADDRTEGRKYESKVVLFSGDYRPDVLEAFETIQRESQEGVRGKRGPTMTIESEDVVLVKEMDWVALEKYFRTWSSYATYLEAFPEEKAKRVALESEAGVGGVGEGDIVNRFLSKLKREVGTIRGVEKGFPERLVVEWPLALLLYRKRSE
ncbi:hypothetical protein FRB91_007634 [Serendipita sp. 411]|nr:hypothetical protein FRB91_007634 [Serendipita sp. 411]